MEKYHLEPEVRLITCQPMLAEEAPATPEEPLEPTTLPLLTDHGKRDLQLWAGTHIRTGGPRMATPVMKAKTKDLVQNMRPGEGLVPRRVETADCHG